MRGSKRRPAWPRSAIPAIFALRGAHPLETTYVGPATCSVPAGPRFPLPSTVDTTPMWGVLRTAVLVIFGA